MKLSVLKKYGYALSEETRELRNEEIEILIDKYINELNANGFEINEEGLFKLVSPYNIPDGKIKPKNYYPIVDGDDAVSIRNHILTKKLVKKEQIENYEVLIENWVGSFEELIEVSKKL